MKRFILPAILILISLPILILLAQAFYMGFLMLLMGLAMMQNGVIALGLGALVFLAGITGVVMLIRRI